MVAVSLKKNFFKQKTAYEIDHCDWSSDVALPISRMPPQLEKNHVGPTAWQDEALARDALLSGGLQNNTDLITEVLCYLLAKS